MSEVATHPAPPIATGMQRVTRDEFFAKLKADARDVMPSLANAGKWDDTIGYVQEWRDQRTRALFGATDGGTSRLGSRYWLL